MSIPFPRDVDGDFLPGTWRPFKDRDGRHGATWSCPDCGHRGGIGPGTNHAIAVNGEVTPSIVCESPCSFHQFIRLEGWHP
jgi:hypothetical protein